MAKLVRSKVTCPLQLLFDKFELDVLRERERERKVIHICNRPNISSSSSNSAVCSVARSYKQSKFEYKNHKKSRYISYRSRQTGTRQTDEIVNWCRCMLICDISKQKMRKWENEIESNLKNSTWPRGANASAPDLTSNRHDRISPLIFIIVANKNERK